MKEFVAAISDLTLWDTDKTIFREFGNNREGIVYYWFNDIHYGELDTINDMNDFIDEQVVEDVRFPQRM